MRRSVAVSEIVFAQALTACSGPTIDLGRQHLGGSQGDVAKLCTVIATADGGSGAGPDDGGAGLGPIVGAWKGYVEAYSFSQSGSDAVVVVFAPQPDGTITGAITFGNEPPLAPPASRDIAYPPGASTHHTPWPYEGFSYTATELAFDGTRLKFGIVAQEVWKVWCSLQSSYDWAPGAPGTCGCLPNTWTSIETSDTDLCTAMSPGSGGMIFSCMRMSLCGLLGPIGPGSVCNCVAGGCSADMHMPASIADMRLSPGRFDGSITNLTTSTLNVHLTLSPPGDGG
jgi:hypothetical protein